MVFVDASNGEESIELVDTDSCEQQGNLEERRDITKVCDSSQFFSFLVFFLLLMLQIINN